MWHKKGWILMCVVVTAIAFVALIIMPGAAAPLIAPAGTAFTYQGFLNDDGSPANGLYDFEFELYDDEVAGGQVGSTLMLQDVTVAEGYFTVELAFGDHFDGTALWLEIHVRPGASTGGYQQLLPRQALTPVPYAAYANIAPWSGLSGVPAGFSDGVDNDTSYTSGDGLTLVANEFNVVFTGSGSSSSVARSDHDHFNDTFTGNSGTGGRALYLSNGALEGFGLYSVAVGEDGIGVYGVGGDFSSQSIGVHGETDSMNQGIGVFGEASSSFCGAIGVYVESANYNGVGVSALASGNGSAIGIRGESTAEVGKGVWGMASSSTGGNIGVYGRTNSSSGFGGAFVNAGGGALLVADDDSDHTDLRFRVTNVGNVYTDGAFTGGGADFAELLPARGGLEPGDVVCMGVDGDGGFCISAFDPTIVGVYSTDPGFVAGGGDRDEDREDKAPIAMMGLVPVKASAENGPIRIGDLLVSAGTPGHAMRCEGIEACFGRTIGKALESLDEGIGVIQMLVMLR